MTRFATYFYCLFFIVFFASLARGDSKGISLAEPPDKTLVEGRLLSVVIQLGQDDVERIIIARNNREIENISALKGKRYTCKTIPIDFGLNIISITAVTAGGKTMEPKEVAVFCRSDISNKARKNPPDFQKRPFHSEGREEACRPCHKMEVTQKDLRPERPEESACYACHSKIVLFKYVHGPAARWTCLACHDKDSRPVKFVTQQPNRVSCFACHSDAGAEWAAKKYFHGPTAAGKCTVCHNPHASDNPFWLGKPTWDLCVSCHATMAKGSHVLKPFALVNKAHPTRGVRDPSRRGEMLTCASCHSPHASNVSTLRAFEEANIYSFCNKCHNN